MEFQTFCLRKGYHTKCNPCVSLGRIVNKRMCPSDSWATPGFQTYGKINAKKRLSVIIILVRIADFVWFSVFEFRSVDPVAEVSVSTQRAVRHRRCHGAYSSTW